MKSLLRQPAVAGTFYPSSSKELQSFISRLLEQAAQGSDDEKIDQAKVKALIVPHAGYIYSGLIAAKAYRCIDLKRVKRIILLGPAHRVPVSGIAAPTDTAFLTPLGEVKVEQEIISTLVEEQLIHISDPAHAFEHCLEVHLPFLQSLLNNQLSIVPLVVGQAKTSHVAEVLNRLWLGDETLLLISSDLSHFHTYEEANSIDGLTSEMILNFRGDEIESEMACGAYAIRGFLQLAKSKGLQSHLLDLKNSGDTAGSKDQVVGYGAYAFTQ